MDKISIQYRKLASPVAVQVELTPRCNNLCNYCYNSWRGNKEFEKELSLDRYMKIAKELAKNDIFEVVITGGEPLLRRDIVYPLADYLSKKNIDVGLNTNLVLITQEDCKNIRNSGITKVLGSLSSHDENTYNRITQTHNYRKVLRGIELLVLNAIPLAINMVVEQENKNQVYDTGKFVHDLGIGIFSGTPALPSPFLDSKQELDFKDIIKTLDDLLRLREEYGMRVDILEPLPRCLFIDPEKYETFLKRDCGAGKITAVISSSGNVRPCTHVPTVYGNMLEEDLRSIWMKMSSWRDGSFLPEECSICKESPYCSSGCRESAKISVGGTNSLDPWAEPGNVGNRKMVLDKITLDGVYKLASGLKFRDEQEEKLIYSPQTMTLGMVNNDFFNFIIHLKELGSFSVESLKSEFGENTGNLLKYLKSKRFIIKED
jgi:AdoMet-dependent heme synthase